MGTGHQLTARLPFSLVGPAEYPGQRQAGHGECRARAHRGPHQDPGAGISGPLCRLEVGVQEQSFDDRPGDWIDAILSHLGLLWTGSSGALL